MDFWFPRRHWSIFEEEEDQEDPWFIFGAGKGLPSLKQRRYDNQTRSEFDSEYYNPFSQRDKQNNCDCLNCSMEQSLRRGKMDKTLTQSQPIITNEGPTFVQGLQEHDKKDLKQNSFDEELLRSTEGQENMEEHLTSTNHVEIEQKEMKDEDDKTEIDFTVERLEDSDNEDGLSESDEDKVEINQEVQEKLNKIEEIQNDFNKIKDRVDRFHDNSKSKEFLYCEEMLTKTLLQLDGVLANGEESIRTARKKAIYEINNCLKTLEEKLSS